MAGPTLFWNVMTKDLVFCESDNWNFGLLLTNIFVLVSIIKYVPHFCLGVLLCPVCGVGGIVLYRVAL